MTFTRHSPMPPRKEHMTRSGISRGEFHARQWWEKPPEGTRARLIRELDIIVSNIVRLRDKRCVIPSCGRTYKLQCSHFFKRRWLGTRFDLRNCNAMCPAHNKLHNTNERPYLKYMLDTYGPEVIAELQALRMGKRKILDAEFQAMLDGYEATYSEMLQEAA